ncbi:hypothetical protein QBC46DRAFT_24732 [Diplogelasinospora grovesii]|uniref:SET domain-containing protein n=1 Tax=Diplogelasinospora grovesii TaxID=303347 RepID=A0AAN6N1M9_9PEZI|nr:hypothetical protein QBC46DRAFT_24732 [Diplogelasinospora grovesii]
MVLACSAIEFEAMGPRSAALDQGHGMTEIRSTGSMGNGLFATKHIPRATQVLDEVPVLAIPASSELDPDDDIPAFCTALQHLFRTEWKRLDDLHCNTALITPARRATIRQWYKDKGITDNNGDTLKGKKLQDAAKATTKRFAIFLTNRVQMGAQGLYGSGVFPLYSRINHSCVPNVHNAYNPGTQRLTLYSIRDIGAGEQITTSYISSACRTRQQRREETENWGFVCSCLACTDTSIDLLRQRMFELDQRLAAYESPWQRRMDLRTSPLARMLAPAMPSSVKGALQDAEQLAELLKRQGLEGMELCKTYRECSKYSLKLGSTEKAMYYARKELDIERCCIGTETAHLQKDMEGAEYWLAHLEHLCGGTGNSGEVKGELIIV